MRYALAAYLCFLCALSIYGQHHTRRVLSPGGLTRLDIGLSERGEPVYKLTWDGQIAVDWSKMGLEAQGYPLHHGFVFEDASVTKHLGTWRPVWGEEDLVHDRYHELQYVLRHTSGLRMIIRARAYPEGVGFRYEITPHDGVDTLRFTRDHTAFRFVADHTCWWIPGDYDSNEHVYSTTTITGIDVQPYLTEEANILTKTIMGQRRIQTPVALRAPNGRHMAIAEAATVDFGALQLDADKDGTVFRAHIVPTSDPEVVSVNTLPFRTPWRAILLSKDAAGLLANRLILNLNEPTRVAEPSWIKPQKYVGIWWEMHIGTGSWDLIDPSTGNPHGRHAANTGNVKRYIDFAATHGFDGVLVEGWNQGWEDWFGKEIEEVFDFTLPYPDYDIHEITRYAREKGVSIIAHHETSGAVTSYERQMDTAYAFMRQFDMNTVKTGYVGRIFPKGEWHDGQWMNNHYWRVAEKTAQNRIMVNMHEAVRPSGLHRTWPNWLACEAARGNEFNAWSRGNPPEHETILPFTRILGGPMDYTPGVFEPRMSTYNPEKTEVVHTTVAKQLALYVTLYSPLQMACDLPEHYEKRLDVFQFIRDVPVDWSESRYLEASIGDYLTIARRQKGSSDWFLGSITDEESRVMDIKLDFLDKGKAYEAVIYADGEGAHWEHNPYPVSISRRRVAKGDRLLVPIAPGGGCAISLKAIR
jgi:hypothetical protein